MMKDLGNAIEFSKQIMVDHKSDKKFKSDSVIIKDEI